MSLKKLAKAQKPVPKEFEKEFQENFRDLLDK